jgi:hypothetical protein
VPGDISAFDRSVHSFGEFTVTNRKPAFLRWLEEAEAKQVCEWADLAHACDRPPFNAARSGVSGERPSLLRRVRGWFGNHSVQIARDDYR